MTPEREDQVVKLSCELVDRVRQVDPDRNQQWLNSLTATDHRDMLICLAAMVDPSKPLSVLLGWVHQLHRDDEMRAA